MKECVKCKVIKDYNYFYKVKTYKDGYSSSCKSCLLEYSRKYRLDNKDKRKETQDKWRNNNPNYHKEWKNNNSDYMVLYLKEWRDNNIGYQSKYEKNRLKYDELFKHRKSISIRTRNALKVKYWVGDSNYNLLGCGCYELKTYFESLFKDGMNWDNYGKWEIDHIIPLVSATNIEDLYKLAIFSNLQPLWKKENRIKFTSVINNIPINEK